MFDPGVSPSLLSQRTQSSLTIATKISEGHKFTALAKIDSLNHLQSILLKHEDLLLTVSPAFWCDDTWTSLWTALHYCTKCGYVWVWVSMNLMCPYAEVTTEEHALSNICHFAFAWKKNIKTTAQMVMSYCANDCSNKFLFLVMKTEQKSCNTKQYFLRSGKTLTNQLIWWSLRYSACFSPGIAALHIQSFATQWRWCTGMMWKSAYHPWKQHVCAVNVYRF